MPATCFYFQVHQPWRLKKFSLFDVANDETYFNDASGTNLDNKWVLQKVNKYCYQPAVQILQNILKRHPDFKFALSLTGTLVEQLHEFAPETLAAFQRLAKSGRVEFLAETYYHTLASVYSAPEFRRQVKLHTDMIEKYFDQRPVVFRNTELIYSDRIARLVEKLGFHGMLAEGADDVLGWRSPNFLYEPAATHSLKLLLKNYKLSDDIAFRFSERSWEEWPLTADKFAAWIHGHEGNAEVINLFMDFETLGEHQRQDSGIFEFLDKLPGALLAYPENYFVTPSQAINNLTVKDVIAVNRLVSWADLERDLSAWTGNEMQKIALAEIYGLEQSVFASQDQALVADWRRLQTSDHFYYMCTKWFADGDVHAYFNPYDSPYESFTSFMNALRDLKARLKVRAKAA